MTLTIKSILSKVPVFIFICCFSSFLLPSCSSKLVNIEANNRCKCIKRVSNEIDRKARKAEAAGRRSSWSNPSYVKGVLKAGSEDCAALRRKSEHRGFVARMTRDERTKYDQEVKEIMLRKCAKRMEKLN